MSEWVSVKDRLPEPLVPVLCFVSGDKEHWFQDIMYINYNDDWSNYYIVSHWKPLPEPPK